MLEIGEPVETIVAFRHGLFKLNERSRLTGQAALLAVEAGIPSDADQTMDLLPEGRTQGVLARQSLADKNLPISACYYSPPLRTKTMAEIVMEGRDVPLLKEPGLMERDRGIFLHQPDEWARAQPSYHIGKESPLYWKPTGGETLATVVRRLKPSVERANREFPGGTVAFSMHAESMVALRALLANMSDERLTQQLVPGTRDVVLGKQFARRVENAQCDIYTRRSPYPHDSVPLSRDMSYFRSIGVNPGRAFDTGWMKI